jgi:hypothetical protein
MKLLYTRIFRKKQNAFVRALETGSLSASLLCPVSQRVQMNYIFSDNVRIVQVY